MYGPYSMGNKLGRVVRMVVDSILPHGEFGPNDHRKDIPPFIVWRILIFVVLDFSIDFSELEVLFKTTTSPR